MANVDHTGVEGEVKNNDMSIMHQSTFKNRFAFMI